MFASTFKKSIMLIIQEQICILGITSIWLPIAGICIIYMFYNLIHFL